MAQLLKVRLGNTITVEWSVFSGIGIGTPFNLEGRKISIYISSCLERFKVESFNVKGNLVSFVWEGMHQKTPGIYRLTLIENEGDISMNTIDSENFVELVSYSGIEGFIRIRPTSNIVLNSLWTNIDSEMSTTSENPLMNKVISTEITSLRNKLDLVLSELDDALSEIIEG